MAENKKSFIAYADWKETFDALSDEKAGQLIKHIFAYVNDENPESEDMLINAVFANIKHTLKRDLRKWEKQHEQRKEAGKKSAEVRKHNATVVNGRSISSTDSVSVSVSVNERKDIYRSFAHLSISEKEFKKLEVEYTKQQIENVLDAIENFKNNTKYKSLYLTSKNWLKKLPKDEHEDKLTKQAKALGYVK
tara:strand:+ start:1762 stop:2337 length:576 start_codon:yes stop_codon:yes gene_type:complete